MKISEIFKKIAQIRCVKNKKLISNHKKQKTIDMYMKMLISDYKISSATPLRISGEIDFFYDKKEIKDVSLSRNNYKYLVYDITGHNGSWNIIEFNDIRKIEEYILSPGGILNMFTSEIIVLENFQNKPYKVYEILENELEKEIFDFEDCTSVSNLIVRWI